MIEHLCGGRRRRLRHREPAGLVLPIEGEPWRPAPPRRRRAWPAVIAAILAVLLSWAVLLLVIAVAVGVIR